MFKNGARPTDWNEWQEMCLQKGIRDSFLGNYYDYQQTKEIQSFRLEDFGREKD